MEIKRVSIFTLLQCITLLCWGQFTKTPEHVNIIGVIFDASTLKTLSNVKAHSRNNTATYSDTQGLFNINISRGDTIYFSYVGYSTKEFVINDSLINNEYTVGIYLSPDTLMLSEVIILNRWVDKKNEYQIMANNNMNLIMSQPISSNGWDADQNTQNAINNFSSDIMNRGHVKVLFGLGTHSITSFNQLKRDKQNKHIEITPLEMDILKKLFKNKKY